MVAFGWWMFGDPGMEMHGFGWGWIWLIFIFFWIGGPRLLRGREHRRHWRPEAMTRSDDDQALATLRERYARRDRSGRVRAAAGDIAAGSPCQQ